MINSSTSKVVLLARSRDGSYRAFGPFRNLTFAGHQILANDQLRTVALWHSATSRWLIGLDAYDLVLIECHDASLPIPVTEI